MRASIHLLVAMQKTQFKFIILVVTTAALLGGWLSHVITSGRAVTSQLQLGTLITPPRTIPGFKMVDAQGHAVSQSNLVNHWSVLFFGYTSCPDVCPTTLAQLAATHKLLGDLPRELQPQFIFVSVDAKRDTPEKLNAYINYFSGDFLGFTGTQQQISDLTKSMGVPVMIQLTSEGAYTIDHSASLFVVNPQSQLAAILSPPYQANLLANDLRKLVAL